MIYAQKTIIFILFLWCANSYAGVFWPDLDINDPTLSKDSIVRQCQKSLQYAPEQLEVWCEKAYKVGYWRALEYIGLHTGNGTRFVSELNKRAERGEVNSIFSLAWNYRYGRFVSKDLEKSIDLFNRYINDNSQQEKIRLNRAHEELLLIYEELGDVEQSRIHKKYLEEHDDTKAKKDMLIKQLDAAGVSSDSID